MATDNESFNRDLYDLLKVRGYGPVPLDSKNQRVPASQAADVIQFTFTKDGKEYGKAWVNIDEAQNVIVYYDEEQQESPSSTTPGVEYNDSWTGFLKHLKNWAANQSYLFLEMILPYSLLGDILTLKFLLIPISGSTVGDDVDGASVYRL
jgi:hypothetical protein